jgi:hypothetical protein
MSSRRLCAPLQKRRGPAPLFIRSTPRSRIASHACSRNPELARIYIWPRDQIVENRLGYSLRVPGSIDLLAPEGDSLTGTIHEQICHSSSSVCSASPTYRTGICPADGLYRGKSLPRMPSRLRKITGQCVPSQGISTRSKGGGTNCHALLYMSINLLKAAAFGDHFREGRPPHPGRNELPASKIHSP